MRFSSFVKPVPPAIIAESAGVSVYGHGSRLHGCGLSIDLSGSSTLALMDTLYELELSSGPPPDYLYHYTSIDGLYGIISGLSI
jgi:hypothetical protein